MNIGAQTESLAAKNKWLSCFKIRGGRLIEVKLSFIDAVLRLVSEIVDMKAYNRNISTSTLGVIV